METNHSSIGKTDNVEASLVWVEAHVEQARKLGARAKVLLESQGYNPPYADCDVGSGDLDDARPSYVDIRHLIDEDRRRGQNINKLADEAERMADGESYLYRSIKSRHEKPNVYPERFAVEDRFANWGVEYPSYKPVYFVHEAVIANDVAINPNGWADPEDFSKVQRDLVSYEGPVDYEYSGRPRNPFTRTGIEGRGLLGKWGPNFAADPIISRTNPEKGQLEVAMILRDNDEWAIPGGMVDAGEDVSQTIEREFAEEAGAQLDMSGATLVYQGYVDDPRNTDNAWMETTAKHLHLDDETAARVMLTAGSDARAVRWMPVTDENIKRLYASHEQIIRKALNLNQNEEQ